MTPPITIRKRSDGGPATPIAGRSLRGCIAFAVALVTLPAMGGTPVFVGTKQSKQVSMAQVDHASLNALLSKYVDENGQVDYRSWKANSADLAQLDAYLSQLSSASRKASATRAARLAFWINAYNAVTIRGILREYPTTSIRNHTPRLWGYHIWKDLKLYVGGQPYSLDAMEHEILRKMNEPRIHFAIVCASIGCPRLRSEAYTAERLEQQLESNAKDFFGRRQNFVHDVQGSRFQVSSILSWFADDFGDDQASRLRKIAPWLPTPAATQAAKQNAVRLSYLTYDWQLNEQKN